MAVQILRECTSPHSVRSVGSVNYVHGPTDSFFVVCSNPICACSCAIAAFAPFRICRRTSATPLRCCASRAVIPAALSDGYLSNSRRNHMSNSNSNSGHGSSGASSGGQQGPNSGNKSDSGKPGASSSTKESQQDQGSSKQKSPGSTQGGTHEQHAKAGQQSHKNS